MHNLGKPFPADSNKATYSVVENSGFTNMLKVNEPRYTTPPPAYFSRFQPLKLAALNIFGAWMFVGWNKQFKTIRTVWGVFQSFPECPLCPLPVNCVLLHPQCPSLSRPKGLLVTLLMQPHTIPFMAHKAKDSAQFYSILYICHFYPCALCSPYLCMHELSQIEPAIEMEIISVSQGLEGNNFLLLET